MLSAGIIIPEKTEKTFFDTLQMIEGVEWCGVYTQGGRFYEPLDKAMIFPSPDILPMLCDLLVILDPLYCNFAYLSASIRNGCNLFLSEKLNLNLEERKELIHLAKEGGTTIQIRNDFLFQPSQNQIIEGNDGNCFIEARQSMPWETGILQEILLNNLFLILKAIGAPAHRVNVYCGSALLKHPDVLNIHINFINGSAASLTLLFTFNKTHSLTIYNEKGFRKFDLELNNPSRKLKNGSVSFSIKNQINSFVKSIEEKTNPFFSISDELEVFLLMEKIREKFELHSVIL